MPHTQKKTIYYYGISVKDLRKNADATSNIRDIFQMIFEEHCYDTDDGKSLILSRANQRITMDILKDDESFLFCRVGKIKSNAEMLVRNLETCEWDNVLDPEELGIKGVEICTYFLLDYISGIVGFIFGQSAPGANILVNIVNEYTDNFNMSIENIISPDTVRTLMQDGAEVSKLNYTFLVPNVEILEYLGLSRDVIDSLGDDITKTVQLSIKNEVRTPLFKGAQAIKAAIDGLISSKNDKMDKISLTGKTRGSVTQDYKFDTSPLSFKLEFEVEEKVLSGVWRQMTPEKLAEEIYVKMLSFYRANKEHLLRFSNRDE